MSKRIRYVQQLELSDCGAACLAMSLQYHGRLAELEEVRRATGSGRDGVDALGLVNAARLFGLQARGVSLDLDALAHLEPGSILHWEFNHFVVFEKLTRKGVVVVDPAMGRRHISMEQFNRSFTGVAILLEPKADLKAGGVAKRRSVMRYLGPLLKQSRLLGKVGVSSILIQLFALAVPILTGVLVDRVVPASDLSLLYALTAGLAVMVLFHFLASFLRAHLLLQLRTKMDLQITLGFVGHMSDLPYSFFLQRSAGDLMMRLNSNTTVREILTASTLSTLLDGSLVALYLLLIVVESQRIALLVIGLAVAQIAILLLSRRRYQRLMSENLDAQARSQSYLVQMLAGIETLKSTGAEPRAVEHWSNLFVNEINVSISRGRLSAIIDSAVGALRVGSPLAILAFGGYEVVRGDLSLGRMLAASALAAGFLIPLSTMVTTALQVFTLRSYMERINDVLDTEADRRYAITSPAPALGGRITVESVSFKYGPLAPLAVDDVSFEIEPGQFVAIVGRSGSGKSTLANLILGLYEPTSGTVLYDGIDLSTIEARSLRQQLGIVPQHPYLFGSSIRDNIALADPATPLDKVMEAAELARIHDDIAAMPMGYETVLADGGATLSGGQRQRIALARALVMKPKVLLLDEATSSLDAGTETEVYQNLERLDCTRVVIAHRLSTIRQADQVIVLEGGKLVESGTHRKLLSKKGHYSELISAQAER